MSLSHLAFAAISIALYYLMAMPTTTSGSMQTIKDSPIQIIAIQSPIGARTISVRDGRTNKANNDNRIINNNNIEPTEQGRSKIIVIQQQNQQQQQHYNHPQHRQYDQPHQHHPYQHNKHRPQILVSNQHSIRLRIAPGAYPVYYAIANANGRFKGQHIRSLNIGDLVPVSQIN